MTPEEHEAKFIKDSKSSSLGFAPMMKVYCQFLDEVPRHHVTVG